MRSWHVVQEVIVKVKMKLYVLSVTTSIGSDFSVVTKDSQG